MANGSVQHLICSECGGERVLTASGMVCPNGHGRIFPPMTNSQIRKVRQAIEIEKLPKRKSKKCSPAGTKRKQ